MKHYYIIFLIIIIIYLFLQKEEPIIQEIEKYKEKSNNEINETTKCIYDNYILANKFLLQYFDKSINIDVEENNTYRYLPIETIIKSIIK